MWADHGRELCWCDGTTVAFHEEITAVMDRLADDTLPDFSSLALALALATLRTSWPEISDRITIAVTSLKASKNPSRHEAEDAREEEMLAVWPDSRRKLTLLTIYVEARSLSTLQRAELLALVFRYCSSNNRIAARLPFETAAELNHCDRCQQILTGQLPDLNGKTCCCQFSIDTTSLAKWRHLYIVWKVSFRFGSQGCSKPNEKPVHHRTCCRPFWILRRKVSLL